MLAYLQIDDPALRKQVVRLAEKFAGHPQPVLIPDLAQDNAETIATETSEIDANNRPKLDPSR